MNPIQLEILNDISDIVTILKNINNMYTDPETLEKALSVWIKELNHRSSQLRNTVPKLSNKNT